MCLLSCHIIPLKTSSWKTVPLVDLQAPGFLPGPYEPGNNSVEGFRTQLLVLGFWHDRILLLTHFLVVGFSHGWHDMKFTAHGAHVLTCLILLLTLSSSTYMTFVRGSCASTCAWTLPHAFVARECCMSLLHLSAAVKVIVCHSCIRTRRSLLPS